MKTIINMKMTTDAVNVNINFHLRPIGTRPSANAVLMTQTQLTHWGRVTHICIGNLTIIGSDDGLLPCRHQAIISTNAGMLIIGPSGTNFSEILIGIQTFHSRNCISKHRLQNGIYFLWASMSSSKFLVSRIIQYHLCWSGSIIQNGK